MTRLVQELDEHLYDLGEQESAHSITVLESSLPYLRNCVKENFRITPVFTMPLARRVMAPEGVTLEGEHFKYGVSLEPNPLENTSILINTHHRHPWPSATTPSTTTPPYGDPNT